MSRGVSSCRNCGRSWVCLNLKLRPVKKIADGDSPVQRGRWRDSGFDPSLTTVLCASNDPPLLQICHLIATGVFRSVLTFRVV